jgi:hypothetical protein
MVHDHPCAGEANERNINRLDSLQCGAIFSCPFESYKIASLGDRVYNFAYQYHRNLLFLFVSLWFLNFPIDAQKSFKEGTFLERELGLVVLIFPEYDRNSCSNTLDLIHLFSHHEIDNSRIWWQGWSRSSWSWNVRSQSSSLDTRLSTGINFCVSY